MLQELGIDSSVNKARDSGEYLLPKNDGSNKLGLYKCKDIYRIVIAGSELPKLLHLGFSGSRVMPTNREYQREAKEFIKVLSISKNKGNIPTYCGNEPKNHTLMFNGVLTKNCGDHPDQQNL